MRLIGHMLDHMLYHMLDHMIMGLVTSTLQSFKDYQEAPDPLIA